MPLDVVAAAEELLLEAAELSLVDELLLMSFEAELVLLGAVELVVLDDSELVLLGAVELVVLDDCELDSEALEDDSELVALVVEEDVDDDGVEVPFP